MVINRLLIPHQHRRYSCIDKYGDTMSFYSRHSKHIIRQPLNSLKFNRQPSKIYTFSRKPSKATLLPIETIL